MLAELRAVVVSFVALTVLTGVVYPLAVTGVAQVAFPHLANGSVVLRNGKPVGSSLIGQPFDDARYFWGRPSATSPAYNAAASTGSNLGPTNPALFDAVRQRVEAIRQAHPDRTGAIPVELVTASASGLDPHIGPAAAEYQVTRVARGRGLPEDRVRAQVEEHTLGRTFGLLGEPRVNVLELNLALDAL